MVGVIPHAELLQPIIAAANFSLPFCVEKCEFWNFDSVLGF